MELGPHSTFIVAAYAATLVIVGALIAWILRDYARLRHTMTDLEKRGIARRSQREKKTP
jgi:heme exporter protein D